MDTQPVYVPEPTPTETPSRKFRMPMWGWILLALAAALFSCLVLFTVLGYLAPTKVSQRSLSVGPSQVSPTATIAAHSSFPLGGLGLNHVDWERQHGTPGQGDPVASGTGEYEQGKYIVLFWGDSAMLILRQPGYGEALSFAQSQQEARAMLPADASFVETSQVWAAVGSQNGEGEIDTLDEYSSPSLVARYPDFPKAGAFPWYDGGPGSIGIIYYGAPRGGWEITAGYIK
jgi:hypothetical protein